MPSRSPEAQPDPTAGGPRAAATSAGQGFWAPLRASLERVLASTRPVPSYWPAGALAGVFLAVALPFMLLDWSRGRGAYDQVFFHEPTIRTFAADLPRPVLGDYQSATAPGYHLILATFARLVSDSRLALQFVGSMFTVALLFLLGTAAANRCARTDPGPAGAARALVLCLPMLASMYVLFPGIWLQPDNAGWLGVLGMLLFALRPAYSVKTLILGGCLLAALVWTRQNHVWTAALLWTWAYLTAADTPDGRVRTLISSPAKRLDRVAAAVLASVPAFLALGFLVYSWQGLVPPSFRAQHGTGFNAATVPFVLALAGVYGVFFFGWAFAGLASLWREQRPLVFAVAGLAMASALYPPTTYLYEARASGLWNVVYALQQRGILLFNHTSPLLVVLAPVGALAIAGMLVQLRPRQRWVMLAALAAFTAAQAANANAWQRYIEPMLLMVFALSAAEIGRPVDPFVPAPVRNSIRAWRWLGPIALAGLLAGVTLWTLARADPVAKPPTAPVAPLRPTLPPADPEPDRDPPPPTRGSGPATPPEDPPRTGA
jgi:hypothetical protein